MNDGLPRRVPAGAGDAAPTSTPTPISLGAEAVSRTSRHAGLATYRRDVGGREAVLFHPRLPDPPIADRTYEVRPGDRLDVIAARTLGDPHAYWRIADANPGDPAALEEPGRQLRIPDGG